MQYFQYSRIRLLLKALKAQLGLGLLEVRVDLDIFFFFCAIRRGKREGTKLSVRFAPTSIRWKRAL